MHPVYSGAPTIYRRQIIILGIAAIIPVLVNILYVTSMNPVPGLDLTPFTFTCVGVILAIGLFRFQLFYAAGCVPADLLCDK